MKERIEVRSCLSRTWINFDESEIGRIVENSIVKRKEEVKGVEVSYEVICTESRTGKTLRI